MSAEAIYFGCATIATGMISTILFVAQDEFRRKLGLLPPRVKYGKDFAGNDDHTNIVWQTPRLTGWSNDDISIVSTLMFLGKFGFLIATLFLLATTFIKANGIK